MAKCLILFGSPRQQGNTATLLEPVMETLRAGGMEICYHDVYNLDIGGCRACLACQKNMEQINCILQDDMQPILQDLESCDRILIAAPIYIWSFPAPIKAVLDRMVYSTCRYYGGDPWGPALLAGKKLYVLTTCGYPTERATELLEESLRRFAKHCGMEYAGLLAERQRNLKDPFMDEGKEEHARAYARQLLDGASLQ